MASTVPHIPFRPQGRLPAAASAGVAPFSTPPAGGLPLSEVPIWRGRPFPMTRAAIEDEIERLVDLLDAADPDPDLEPSLGWGSHRSQAHILVERTDDPDLEWEHDGLEPDPR